jgi:hypothetical protein
MEENAIDKIVGGGIFKEKNLKMCFIYRKSLKILMG